MGALKIEVSDTEIKKKREKKGGKEEIIGAKLEVHQPHTLPNDGGSAKKI